MAPYRKMATQVKSALGRQKMTQSELARKSGQSAMQISRILSGKYMPSAISLHRVAHALNCEVSDFFS